MVQREDCKKNLKNGVRDKEKEEQCHYMFGSKMAHILETSHSAVRRS